LQNSRAHPTSNPNFGNYLSSLNIKIGKVQNKVVVRRNRNKTC